MSSLTLTERRGTIFIVPEPVISPFRRILSGGGISQVALHRSLVHQIMAVMSGCGSFYFSVKAIKRQEVTVQQHVDLMIRKFREKMTDSSGTVVNMTGICSSLLTSWAISGLENLSIV